jgi:hypothetical protein
MENDPFRERFLELRKELAKTGFICSGTVMSVLHKCGNSNCECARDRKALHGPYNRWTRKVKGKTVTRTLTDRQVELCRRCIQNYRRLEGILEEMKKLSVLYIENKR